MVRKIRQQWKINLKSKKKIIYETKKTYLQKNSKKTNKIKSK